VLRGQRLPAPVHHGKQGIKEGGGALAIGIDKGGAGHRLDSQVVEVLMRAFRLATPPRRLAQAVSCM